MKGLICKNFNQTHTRGGGGEYDLKKPLLSLACIFALACATNLQADAEVTEPENPQSNFLKSHYSYQSESREREYSQRINPRDSIGCSHSICKYDQEYTKVNFAENSSALNWNYRTTDWNKLTIKSIGSIKWQNFGLHTVNIKEANMKGNTQIEFQIKTGSNSITTLNHNAKRINFKINGGSGGTLTITTLNQDSTNGDTQLFNGVSIQTVNLTAGKFYQYAGTINTLHIKNGTEFRQGLKDNGTINSDGDGGTITNLTIDNGTFTKAKGSVTGTITNTNGNINNMANSSINTITSTNGNITNAGTITSLTYKAAPTTKAIQTKASTDSITNTGTITTFTNDGGNLTNTGSIQTYTQESGNTMQSGGTIQTLTQKGGNFTYQGGTIGSLKQEGGSFNNLQQNISLFTTQGGSLNNIQGTIENLKITSGDFELNNMQQGRIANIEIGGNGKININDNMNIGYNNGISTFRIANGAAPTLNFGEVRTATTAQETYATVKLVDTNNANTTQAKVAIDKLTIALVSEDTQIGKSVSLANSVSGAANTGVGNVYVKSADFSQDLKQSGFYGKFNAQTQTIDTRFNANLGAAGLFSQAFINQLGRRSLLFDSFLNEASRASLRYKRTQPDTNFDIFVRPYYSKIKTDLADIPEKADGTSSGILAGGHTYFDNSLLMLYGAVEKNKTHLADDVFNFDSDTFLLGSKYSIELAQSHIGQLFGGVDIRGSYTKADLEREPVSGFKSQGDAKNYAYDARVFLASIIYYNLQDHSQYLTPQIGIGHTGAKLKGFDMKGNKLAYKESLDDMTYGITYATASLNWFKRKDNVAIQLDGGVRVNLNNEIDTQTKINNQNFTNHFETSKYYSQLGGAFMWINPYGVDVSLGYKFLFGESATSHTASLRLHKTF
ncbi:autotransporter outer membrane beta-barrel domain-containing protein [Campylobacter upsaliensis]|uniref:autotransporter outer membrane beta-barrel domain-containing protein n=1 Tax=Campylobacter upsaliensis TaxID=28080 RepID=UPI001CE0BD47|nr:autotransporter outer membrane beta-barrel domain-containing protein [Campylobacter upsaliensis]MCA5589558.1 autotransporter outer membrane beta-barrel domain-containing protein [Campylobacter upsaliensis]